MTTVAGIADASAQDGVHRDCTQWSDHRRVVENCGDCLLHRILRQQLSTQGCRESDGDGRLARAGETVHQDYPARHADHPVRRRNTPDATRPQTDPSPDMNAHPMRPLWSSCCPTCPSVPGRCQCFCTGSPDPRQHPFGSGNSPVRPVIRERPAEGPVMVSRFPAAFRPPAFASRVILSRQGVGPSSRSAYRTTIGPDPDGVSMFHTREI